MASTGVNVLRWSALGAGLFYGIYHQSTIKAADKIHAARAEYHRQEKLIAEAKTAFARKNQPQDKSNDVISDPEHPNFDFEKFLTSQAAEA